MLDAVKNLLARLSGGRWFPGHNPRWADLSTRERLAARGEMLALRELRRAGYRILARRWRWHRYELDLIARKGDVIAVAEVKTRSDDSFGEPQEAVPRRKQRHIAVAARAYVARHRLEDCLLRFDIVAVRIPPKGKPQVQHIENAFTF